MQRSGKVARAVRPRECGTAESRARTPRERTPGSSKLNRPLPQVGAPQVLRYRDSAYKGARERPDTSGNSGGTADITRQLVRPGTFRENKAVFFIIEIFSGGKTLWNVPRSFRCSRTPPPTAPRSPSAAGPRTSATPRTSASSPCRTAAASRPCRSCWKPASWPTTKKSSTPVCTAACASRASWCSPRRLSSPLS